jgi:RNA polymerase sigma-70 factor (ECF subfamily)
MVARADAIEWRMTSERIEDEVLVLRCQEGDSQALDEMLSRWQERLWRHAHRLTEDRDGAWDVLQEAFLGIARGINRLEDPAAFPAWAYRIVNRKSTDWVRRRIRHRRREAASAAALHQMEEGRRETVRKVATLRDAMRQLTGADRALLALRYEEGFTIAQVAAVLDLPEGTVKSRIHYARERLRQLLMEESDHA